MILKIELEDISEEELRIHLGEDLDAIIKEKVSDRVHYLVKELVEKRFKERIIIELEQMSLPALREALKHPEVQQRIDFYAKNIVHDVVKKRVMAHTEAWLKTSAEASNAE